MLLRRLLFPAAIVFVWPFLCLSAPAFADTVVVRSGERLGGKILHKSGDTLILQTDYAGEIKIQWSKVVALITDAPVALRLDGATSQLFRARLEAQPDDQIALVREEAKPADSGADAERTVAETVPLSRVMYINPLPEETLSGVTYKGRANFSFSKAQGNVRHAAMYGETALTARAREYRYELNAKANRAEDFGMLTSSSWLVGGNYDRFIDPRHFIYGRTSIEHDQFKGIDRRDVIGGGYGLQLIDTPRTQFSVRGGLDFVKLRHVDSSEERYPSLGWGIKISQKLESYRAELFHEQEGFWNINDVGQITLRTRSGLRVPLLAGITATSQLNVDWERQPNPGRKATDSMLLFGLGYEW